jgi:RNA 2',3'-cyclic 3'-phosphodiesterase
VPSTDPLRLFFALRPAPAQNAALVESVAQQVTSLRAQRVPPENLHATLCFIGAVPVENLEHLQGAAARVRARPAALRFDSLEFWQEPKVLCATVSEEAEAASARELAAALATVCVAAGFTPDVKPFRAHLTLARKVDAAQAAMCAWPQPLASPLLVHGDHFFLMRSDRGESGSIYSVVASWPLDGEGDADKSR